MINKTIEKVIKYLPRKIRLEDLEKDKEYELYLRFARKCGMKKEAEKYKKVVELKRLIENKEIEKAKYFSLENNLRQYYFDLDVKINGQDIVTDMLMYSMEKEAKLNEKCREKNKTAKR